MLIVSFALVVVVAAVAIIGILRIALAIVLFFIIDSVARVGVMFVVTCCCW